jgi:hypothetical protein
MQELLKCATANKLILFVLVCLSIYFVFKAGNALGEFIYWIKH